MLHVCKGIRDEVLIWRSCLCRSVGRVLTHSRVVRSFALCPTVRSDFRSDFRSDVHAHAPLRSQGIRAVILRLYFPMLSSTHRHIFSHLFKLYVRAPPPIRIKIWANTSNPCTRVLLRWVHTTMRMHVCTCSCRPMF